MANTINVGLGTKIAKGLKAIGIPTCKGCSVRVDKVNKAEVRVRNIFSKKM